MDEYRKYLAENVLSEDKVITYRFLSRALKVHVNTAKQMLYDFHQWQNSKRPGSVHATYLVYGSKKEEQTQVSQDGDIEMSSSPPEAEQQDVVAMRALQLVPESDLQDALETYEEVTSLHVYSLGPQPLKDMALLSDAARQVSTLSAPSDSASASKIYGTITNTNVRRRERKGAGAKLAAAAPAKAQPKPSVKPAPAPAKPKEEAKPVQKPAEKETPAAPAETKKTSTASGQAKKPTPALKRGGSNIMASFAKGAAAAVKKAESRQATPSGDESSKAAMSDDEEDDSAVLPKPRVQEVEGRKSRQQKKEDLQRMMEEDDDEEEVKEKEDSPEEEPVEEEPAPEPEMEEPAEVVASTGDGRRRGKRKVMKKKQILDDQGYLVTIQEPTWESFSEDEAPKPAPKPKPSSAPSTAASKAKKAAGPKGSQGSIMSFFSKKT